MLKKIFIWNQKLDFDEDLDPLIAAVKEKKQIQRERKPARVLVENTLFSDMVASLAAGNQMDESSIQASLDTMKVYKVYPEYEAKTLPPPTEVAWFGGIQMQDGVKNGKLDSLYGNIDGYF